MRLVNTYTGGIDRDLSIEVHQNNTLYDCQNMRILTDEGLSTSALENVKGTVLLKDFTDDSYENHAAVEIAFPNASVFPDARYVGSCVIRDINVIFTTESETGGTDQIWEMRFDRATNSYKYWLRYTGDLNLSTEHPIYRAIGRYESTDAVKVYWTDNFNVLRYLNLSDINATTGLLDIPDTSFLEMKNRADLRQPTLRQVSSGGRFHAGMIQYVYQYFNKYASTSFFSPPSEMIHLTAESDFKGTTQTYLGSDLGDDVYKSIYVSIPALDNRYNYVRVWSFFYAEITSTPIITLIAEKEVSGTSITIVDTGTEAIDTLAYTTYAAQRNQEDFICKGLTEFKNMLFPANIDEVEWDVDYDARATRFKLDPGNRINLATGFPYTPEEIYNHYTGFATPDMTLFDNSTDGAKDIMVVAGGGATLNVTDVDAFLTLHPETEDDYNISLYNRTIHPQDYDMKCDRAHGTARIGGTGINISYRIKIQQILIDNAALATRTYTGKDNTTHTVNGRSINNTSYTNMASPYLSGLYRGYQRGEVYSFGIVFYDKKGRSSFVKWIGDIKMPNQDDINGIPTFTMNGVDYYDYRLCMNETTTGFMYGNIIYPEFYVNIPAALSQEISSFDIVRCKRSEIDRTVIGYGPVVASTSSYVLEKCYIGTMPGVPPTPIMGNHLMEFRPGLLATGQPTTFHSPEIAYNKNQIFDNSDYLVIDAIGYGRGGYDSGGANPFDAWEKWMNYVPVTQNNDLSVLSRYMKITEGDLLDTDDEKLINGYGFHNSIQDFAGAILGKGTMCSVMSCDTNFLNGVLMTWFYNSGMFAWYKRKAGANNQNNPLNEWQYPLNIYNGEGYYDRARRTYISCGVNYPVTESATDLVYLVKCFGGDTFISMHEQLITAMNIPVGSAIFYHRMISYPTESTINCDLIMGNTITKGEALGNTFQQGYYQEEAGIYTDGFTGTVYTQGVDMYKYNTVYSHENDTNEFIPKPIHYIIERLDCEIRFSNQKFDRELIDSWTIFDTNSFNSVSSQYGAITDVLSWKEQFVFIQPNAIGLYAVNERSLISDQSGQQLSLGSSGVLERYDYKSYDAGSRLQGSTIATGRGIYFFDDRKRRISRFGASERGIGVTEITGLNSFLYYNYNKTIENDDCVTNENKLGIVAGWNKRFEEVYFTFKNNAVPTSENYTLALNELTGKFMSFFDFHADGYINGNNGFLSMPNAGTYRGNKLYVHDEGLYGEFYGTYNNALLETITTHKGMVGIFDILEYHTDVFSQNPNPPYLYDVDVFDMTFDNVRVRNDYQDSQTLDLVIDDTVQRRMRKWRISEILRDDSEDYPRMRDTYMRTQFIFLGSHHHNRLVVHPIETEVRIHGL